VLSALYSQMLHRPESLCCCVCNIIACFVPDVKDLPNVPQHEPRASSVPVSRSGQLLNDWRHCSRFADDCRSAKPRC